MFRDPHQRIEPKRNNFHFPLSTSCAEQNEAQIIYIYINLSIQFLIVAFHVPLSNQSIQQHRTEFLWTSPVGSPPQSCVINLRLGLTARTWSKRWGLGVTSLSWRRWALGLGVNMSRNMWRWSNEETYMFMSENWGILDFTLGVGHITCQEAKVCFAWNSWVWEHLAS